jgi:hypothetical protein
MDTLCTVIVFVLFLDFFKSSGYFPDGLRGAALVPFKKRYKGPVFNENQPCYLFRSGTCFRLERSAFRSETDDSVDRRVSLRQGRMEQAEIDLLLS